MYDESIKIDQNRYAIAYNNKGVSHFDYIGSSLFNL